MNCPKCQNLMREREKGHIVIDICSSCRGIYLDAGELEKLMAAEARVYERRGWDYDDEDGFAEGRYREENRGRVKSYDARNPQYPRKKKSFLSSMFESFGEGGDD